MVLHPPESSGVFVYSDSPTGGDGGQYSAAPELFGIFILAEATGGDRICI